MKSEEKVIGGFRYRMTQVGAETGEQIELRLSRPMAALFARVAAKAAKGGAQEVSLIDLAISGAGPALAELTGRDLRYVRKKLVDKTVVWLPDGKKTREWPLVEVYDDHFAGRYADALTFLRWGLGMNRFFGDALDRLDAMLAARAKTKDEASRFKSPAAPGGGGAGDSSSASTDAQA